jgi:hypothetical protein
MIKPTRGIAALLCLATVLGSVDAGAASAGNGRGNRDRGDNDDRRVYTESAPVSGAVSVGGNIGGVDVGVTITAGQARQIAVDNRFVGYSSLPPGIAKNLARGKPLPPGIAKKLVPNQMLTQLPHYDGYEWRVAGTDLILVAIGTLVVAEILNDVFL